MSKLFFTSKSDSIHTIMKPIIVIPTYNEGGNIEPLLAGIRAEAPDAHILFVDDNSRDETQTKILQAMNAAPGTIFLLKRAGKLGLASAYLAGFRWGLDKSYEYLGEMDADLSHRAQDLAKIVRAAQPMTAIVGSRYIPGGGTVNWNWRRKLISRFGSLYAGLILGIPIHDLTGGFNLWHRGVLEGIRLDTMQSEGYSFQIELKYRAFLIGSKLIEVPIIFEERRAGYSKMSGRIVWEASFRVIQFFFRRSRFLVEAQSRAATPK